MGPAFHPGECMRKGERPLAQEKEGQEKSPGIQEKRPAQRDQAGEGYANRDGTLATGLAMHRGQSHNPTW